MSKQIEVRHEGNPEIIGPIMEKYGMKVIDVSDKSTLFEGNDYQRALKELKATSENWAVDLYNF